MTDEQYIEIQIFIVDDTYKEMVLAELTLLGFDQMEEHDWGYSLFSKVNDFNPNQIQEMVDHYSEFTTISWRHETKDSKNWNEEWEKSYEPIVVGNCRVRASFHPADHSFDLELIINPKMSFGTGHHETTRLMMDFLLNEAILNTTVGDVGTGSGILAILTAKKGAKEIFGCDVDDWVIENAQENAVANAVGHCNFSLGTIGEIKIQWPLLDILLANINRNVLLDEMPFYSAQLKSGGTLLLSGFLKDDIDSIADSIQANGMILNEKRIGTGDWAALKATKP